MNQYASMIRKLKTAPVMEQLSRLYGNRDGMLVEQTARYISLLKRHEETFNSGDGPVFLISAPGRTEIGGNHTDHNRGKVLAAAVNLDTVSAVSARKDMTVHLHSDGYPALVLNLSELSPQPAEKGTTAALIRGVAERMQQLGYKIGGFDAVVTSNVSSGSGLSSSAAFEVLTCAILDKLYNGWSIDYKLRAQISQYAENVHFGKPSGLLDQMASAAGGLVFIDFKTDDPVVRPLNYDFSKKGYALAVVNTGGSHADLTDDYAAIPREMKQVAACFDEEYLRRVRPEQITQELPRLRSKVSDRAIMRASIFSRRTSAWCRKRSAVPGRSARLFEAIIASGRSSFMYLQNVYARPDDQSSLPGAVPGGGAPAGKGRMAHSWRRICRHDAEFRPHD